MIRIRRRRRNRRRFREPVYEQRGQRSQNHVANSNTQESREIQGFYYDAERNRHFRIPLPGDHNLMQTDARFQMKEDQAVAFKTLKALNSSLLKTISDRQIGNSVSHSFCRSVSKQRLKMVRKVAECAMPEYRTGFDCLHLLSGTNNSVIAAWCAGFSSITLLDFYERRDRDANLFDCSSYELVSVPYITDVVAYENSWGLNGVVCSSIAQGGRSSELTKFCFHSCGYAMSPIQNRQKCFRMIFSLSYDKQTKTVATGGENQICLISNNGCDSVLATTNGENIHSLCYEEDGRCLVAGSHRGCVLYCDTRTIGTPTFKIDTGRHLLCHIRKLGSRDDPYVVCSGYDDYLALIDMRMRKQVLKYDGHVNRDQKVRFSVDSCLEVVCSSGQDGRTRTWNLKNGEPILSIEPPDGYDGRSGNVHSVLKGPDCKVYDPNIVVVYKGGAYLYRSSD